MEHNFITLHCISPEPGNAVHVTHVRSELVRSFGQCSEQYIRLGAASFVDVGSGIFYVKETEQELLDAITEAEKAKV